MSEQDINHFLEGDGVDTEREKIIGQHIGYRYDVNLVPDMEHCAVFDRNINGWVTIPEDMELPDNQQDRDMIAREMLIKFQMSDRHPMVDLRKAYEKFS